MGVGTSVMGTGEGQCAGIGPEAGRLGSGLTGPMGVSQVGVDEEREPEGGV